MLKMGRKTQRPSVINMSYKQAEAIMHEYSEQNEIYLRSLIKNHIPNYQLVLDCPDRQNILYHTRTIKCVAKRMLESCVSQNVKKAILKSIDALDNSKNSSQRELLDERICIQFEGCKVPDHSYLVKKYEEARRE